MRKLCRFEEQLACVDFSFNFTTVIRDNDKISLLRLRGFRIFFLRPIFVSAHGLLTIVRASTITIMVFFIFYCRCFSKWQIFMLIRARNVLSRFSSKRLLLQFFQTSEPKPRFSDRIYFYIYIYYIIYFNLSACLQKSKKERDISFDCFSMSWL